MIIDSEGRVTAYSEIVKFYCISTFFFIYTQCDTLLVACFQLSRTF